MPLTMDQRYIARRLANDVVTQVERRPDEHLGALVLRVARDVPVDRFREAFVEALADVGIDFVDITVEPVDTGCCLGPLHFEPP
jgi:hypothetical protein